MKGQVQSALFAVAVATLISIGAPTAEARECHVARPSTAHGHWSWRLIDGRKCWYAGKTMISKSLLKWPVAASAQAKARVAPARVDPVSVNPVSVAMEKRGEPMDAQARMLDDENSFESRWRARAIAE
jgi:hypothetical protein